uniref:14_3_3 domain-containing protein n=1 Tax=Steinernema glaseri TaxID=37863 RepID=A0A1I7YGX1_9BILA
MPSSPTRIPSPPSPSPPRIDEPEKEATMKQRIDVTTKETSTYIWEMAEADMEEYYFDQRRLELFKEVLKNTDQPQGHKDAALEYFNDVRRIVYKDRPHLLKALGLK